MAFSILKSVFHCSHDEILAMDEGQIGAYLGCSHRILKLQAAATAEMMAAAIAGRR